MFSSDVTYTTTTVIMVLWMSSTYRNKSLILLCMLTTSYQFSIIFNTINFSSKFSCLFDIIVSQNVNIFNPKLTTQNMDVVRAVAGKMLMISTAGGGTRRGVSRGVKFGQNQVNSKQMDGLGVLPRNLSSSKCWHCPKKIEIKVAKWCLLTLFKRCLERWNC